MWDAMKPVVFDGGVVNMLFYLLFLVQNAGVAVVDIFLFLSYSLCGCTILVPLVFETPVYLNMPKVPFGKAFSSVS